mmetsp:Transcript_55508/g.146374  ORF Transcript_55508/g.146374 Transcript_55508/m.146374 type:complete len:219 (+) Transcript_55508:473-1129(+)
MAGACGPVTDPSRLTEKLSGGARDGAADADADADAACSVASVGTPLGRTLTGGSAAAESVEADAAAAAAAAPADRVSGTLAPQTVPSRPTEKLTWAFGAVLDMAAAVGGGGGAWSMKKGGAGGRGGGGGTGLAGEVTGVLAGPSFLAILLSSLNRSGITRWMVVVICVPLRMSWSLQKKPSCPTVSCSTSLPISPRQSTSSTATTTSPGCTSPLTWAP